MGCRTSEAVADWNNLLQPDIRMPFLLGYNEVVSKFGQKRMIYKVLCKVASFLTTEHITTLDQDLDQLASLTTDAVYHLPIILRGVTPYYATAADIHGNHGLAVREYLDLSAAQWAEDHPLE